MASPGTIRFVEINTVPSAPPAGSAIIYVKTDNVIYLQDSSGIEVPLGTASGITSLTGEATATGPGSSVITLSNSAVIGKILTGFTSGPNSTVLATDTLLQAIQKLQAQVSAGAGSAITSLTGDVTGTGPGATSTTVATVGGKSASSVASAVDDVQAATPTNTASTIVERDASGNFSANVITANLSGNASTATSSTSFSGSLVGDVTGTQAATVVATVGGKSAAAVSSSVDDTQAATSINTASTIVERDASGNFAANTITANLTGVASGNELPIVATTAADYYRGDKTFQTLDKAAVGLANVDNTSDVDKPVSSAQALADTAVQDYSIQRSNHTGTQPSTTISDFDEAAQDAVGTILVDSPTINLNYDDSLNEISAAVVPLSIGNSELSAEINANKIADGSVSNTEFQYLDGATSNLQTQITNRELLANKATDLTVLNNTLYPTTQAVQSAINSSILVSPVFILSALNSDVSGYKSLVSLPSFISSGLATISQTVSTSETLMEEFATNVGVPNVTALASGILSFHYEMQKSSGPQTYYSYVKVYKRSSLGVETLLLTSDNSSEISDNAVNQIVVVALNPSIIPLLVTDRIVIKIYAVMLSGAQTISLRYDDNTDARVQFPGSSLNYVPEDILNKSTDGTLAANSAILYPSQSAVKTYADTKQQKIENVLVVQMTPGPGEFSSIAAAADSILDSSPTNLYVIKVGPGEYTEPVINVPEYVSVVGSSIQTTVVKPATNSQHLFVLNTGCELSFLHMVGLLGANKAGIYVANVGDFALTHKVSIYDFDIGIHTVASSADCILYVEYTDINGAYTNAVKAESSGGFTNRTQLENFYTFESTASGAIAISGSGTTTDLQLFSVKLFCEPTQKGVVISNGTSLRMNGADIQGSSVGVEVLNTGAGGFLSTLATSFKGNTLDYNVAHPSATGSIFGGSAREKVVIDASASVSVLILDTEDKGIVLNGPIFYSQVGYDAVTDISQLLVNTPAMGKIFGGELSVSSGLTLSIAAGYGYNMNGTEPNDVLHKRDWVTSTLLLPDNSAVFVYINSVGAFVSNPSEPDTEENLLLGRVTTISGTIAYIEQTPLNAHHIGNNLSRSSRHALGGVFVSGSNVSESGTRQLEVDAGHYHFGELKFAPTGGSPITFDTFYRSVTPGVYTRTTGQTTVSNTLYDNNSGTLASIPSLHYVKHLVMMVGGPSESYLLVYGSATYSTLLEAENAPLPAAPSFAMGSFVRIASIIVREGSSAIQEIIDERPRIGFASSSVVGGVSSHSALSDLSADDHTQYLLVSGSRAMSGSLDMGTNDITNVGTVDGVDISAHASRHLPNGADPLTTAAAISLNATSGNSEGVQNSFSRSDHTHGLSTAAAISQTPDQTNAAGVSADLARADHVHNIPAATPVNIGTSNFKGAAASFALSDHVHSHGNQTNGSLHAAATTSVNGFMSAADKTKLDNSTELNTASAIVQRDASGNFSAGTITASLSGAASDNLLKAGDTMTGFFRSAIVALADGASISTDVTLGNTFTVTLGGNRTLANPTGMGSSRQKATWAITQDATGGRTLAFDTAFNFGIDLIGLSLSSTPNATDYIGAIYNPVTSKWDVIAITRGY